MTAIKNGIKSAIRTPGKTLLFLLILTVTAALLTVSFCVYGAVRGYLNDCDEYFHTIAELEYMGSSYPDPDVYDEALEQALEAHRSELEALRASDGVLSFEPGSSEIALSPLIHRWDDMVPEPDIAVLKVKLTAYDEALDLYTAIVCETLYSRKDYTDKLIIVRAANGGGSLDSRSTYYMAGRFYVGLMPNPSFQQEQAVFKENGTYVEVPLQQEGSADPDDRFLRYAENLRVKNDACRVTYTAAIEDLYPFHQQLLHLTKGRYFTEEEYQTRAHVCIVSERVSGLLGLDVGDSIPFEVLHATEDLYDVSALSRIDSGDYEIVGIQNHDENYPYWIFLPDAAAENASFHPVNGYTLGQFRLRNDTVADFLIRAKPLLEAGFRLNVYDQGYAAATEPMEQLLFISGVFLAVCLLLAVCAMALQSYIFISRQRETARTMYALGSGKAHVRVYYLSAALVMAASAAAAGGLIGNRVEGRVFNVLKDFATQFADQDLRFSTSRLAIVRTLEFDPVSSPRSYLTGGLLLLAGVTVFSLVFTAVSLREKQTKKRRAKQRRLLPRKLRSSKLSGFFKYGLLSLRRGSVRTLAVLLLGVVTAAFFGHLSSSLTSYETQLAAYKKNAVINGSATDMHGKRISGLVLKPHPIAALTAGDLVEDCCVTTNLGNVRILGVPGSPDYTEFIWPISAFAYETAFDHIRKEPTWMGVSSVENSPLFHYAKGGSVEWAAGRSEADFTARIESTYQQYDPHTESFREASYITGPSICAISRDMAEEYGLQPGDRIDTVAAYYIGADEHLAGDTLEIAAIYTSPGKSDIVFSPVSYIRQGYERQSDYTRYRPVGSDFTWISSEKWSDAEIDAMNGLGMLPNVSYSSFTFTLRDNTRLDELRSVLSDSGFTWVRSKDRSKSYMMIEDEVYLSTVHSMERQIQYVTVLYDALYLLTGVIGLTLAWLLVQSRRREIAVMRALGTQPIRLVLNFFVEQLILMSAGLGLGLLVCRMTGVSFNRTQRILTAAFLAVWSISTLLCLLSGLRKRSYAALTEPE